MNRVVAAGGFAENNYPSKRLSGEQGLCDGELPRMVGLWTVVYSR